MRTSFRDLEKRLSRIERRLDPPAPCNCRLITRVHDANCLAAILEKTERKCPVHGFREMGSLFMWSPQYPLVDEDNQFCPCPPHPWRSLQLRGESVTKEERDAAMQAWHDMPRPPEGNSRRTRIEYVRSGSSTTRNEISGSGEPGGSCPASRRSGTSWPDDIANVTDNRSCH